MLFPAQAQGSINQFAASWTGCNLSGLPVRTAVTFARLITGLAVSCLATALAAATSRLTAVELRAAYQRPASIPFPTDNLYTPEKAALGKALFFDPRLSGNQNITCASCHNPSFGWEVPVRTPVGAQNTALPRHAPTVLNQAWVHPFFWDGRASTLEQQAAGPITAAAEMNLPLANAVTRLNAVSDYRDWFQAVFPGQGVTATTIVQAVATFERTVVASYSPFDAWVDGDETAISDKAKRGFMLFNGQAKCAVCHSGWNLTDNRFHDIGLPGKDIGRGQFEPGNVKAQFAFKTPSLRDVTQRAPFMHDGSLPTLDDVLNHYANGIIDRPSRSDDLKDIVLGPDDIDDLLAFLKTLTGSRQVVTLPVLPN